MWILRKTGEYFELIDHYNQLVCSSENETNFLHTLTRLLNVNNNKIKVCFEEYKNSVNRAFTEIPIIVKEINNKNKGTKFFNQLDEFIEKNYPIGSQFGRKEIQEKLSLIDDGWNNSLGDKTLAYLGLLICQGKIKLNAFNKGRPGHIYEVTSKVPCKYWNTKLLRCDNCIVRKLKDGREKRTKKFLISTLIDQVPEEIEIKNEEEDVDTEEITET